MKLTSYLPAAAVLVAGFLPQLTGAASRHGLTQSQREILSHFSVRQQAGVYGTTFDVMECDISLHPENLFLGNVAGDVSGAHGSILINYRSMAQDYNVLPTIRDSIMMNAQQDTGGYTQVYDSVCMGSGAASGLATSSFFWNIPGPSGGNGPTDHLTMRLGGDIRINGVNH